MIDHESALQKALVAALQGDAALAALLDGRVWDQAPQGAAFPHLLIGRCESRPLAADGGGVEQALIREPLPESRAVVAGIRVRGVLHPRHACGRYDGAQFVAPPRQQRAQHLIGRKAVESGIRQGHGGRLLGRQRAESGKSQSIVLSKLTVKRSGRGEL